MRPPRPSLDQRDQYINQLSQLMDVKVSNSDFNQVSVFTSSGIQLVGAAGFDAEIDAQGTRRRARCGAPINQEAMSVPSRWCRRPAAAYLLANKAIRSGQIAAYLDMRDNVLVQAQSQLDAIAAQCRARCRT